MKKQASLRYAPQGSLFQPMQKSPCGDFFALAGSDLRVGFAYFLWCFFAAHVPEKTESTCFFSEAKKLYEVF